MNVTQVTRPTTIVSTLLAILLLFSVSAVAQDGDEYYEDDYRDILQVSIFGGLGLPSGGVKDWTTETASGAIDFGPKTGFGLGTEIGYFATPSLIVGLRFIYNQYAIDTDIDAVDSRYHRTYCPSLYALYYFFGESDFVPYVRAHAGIDFVKFTTSVRDVPRGNVFEYRELSYDPGFAFGAGLGIFYYTHDYGGLFLEANYHQGLVSGVTGSYEGLDYEFGEDMGLIDVHFGIRVFFGSE